MSPVPHPSRRPLALAMALALAVALLLALTAAPPATSAARAYPPGVKQGFMRTCVPTALDSSDGSFNRRQAKIYCRTSYSCLEKRLTLREFQKVGQAKRGRIARVRDMCIEKAARKALNG